MPRTISIITRESRLALWQTNAVITRLSELGQSCATIPVKSTGDIDLVRPIYELGVQGVFTKELDAALLRGDADVAVHSLKDIPTQPAKGLTLAAILERGASDDILFVKRGFRPEPDIPATIATSSIRRKAQWQERFPKHNIVNVRGNVETRLQKFSESSWDAMLLAKAGVERLSIGLADTLSVPWMLPSPAQGAIAVVVRADDSEIMKICNKLDDFPTRQCVTAERDFLRHLHGGCSVPISAHARLTNNDLHFDGAVHSPDGSKSFRVKIQFDRAEWKEAGVRAGEAILASVEGREIVSEIQRSNRPQTP
jgi:hydroxymethylbilane synthase